MNRARRYPHAGLLFHDSSFFTGLGFWTRDAEAIAEASARRTAWALQVLDDATDPLGTPAAAYLRSRGLVPPFLPGVRWLEGARLGEGAIVGVLTTALGDPVGIQLGHLDPQGRKSVMQPERLPVQGICADCMMRAIAYVHAEFGGALVAMVHDELIAEVPANGAEAAAETMKACLHWAFVETFPGAPTAGLINTHLGASWAELKGSAPSEQPAEPRR